jgi:hypothetical protein
VLLFIDFIFLLFIVVYDWYDHADFFKFIGEVGWPDFFVTAVLFNASLDIVHYHFEVVFCILDIIDYLSWNFHFFWFYFLNLFFTLTYFIEAIFDYLLDFPFFFFLLLIIYRSRFGVEKLLNNWQNTFSDIREYLVRQEWKLMTSIM